MVLPLDVFFGLPRKKATRKSHRDPLHGEIFFANQSSVDKHVAMYKMLNQQTGNASVRILDGHVCPNRANTSTIALVVFYLVFQCSRPSEICSPVVRVVQISENLDYRNVYFSIGTHALFQACQDVSH